MKYLAAAALAAAFVAAPASASDEVTYRVEVHGGWERVSVGGGKANGEFYGVGVGFDVPVSATMFIGFESNADLSTTKKCFGNVFSGRYCQEGKRDLSANARIGVKAAKDVKIYVLAGYTNARIRDSFTSSFGSSSASLNGDGLRLGAGTEIRLGGAAYTKLEYRYSNYEAGFERHQIVGGLGFAL